MQTPCLVSQRNYHPIFKGKTVNHEPRERFIAGDMTAS